MKTKNGTRWYVLDLNNYTREFLIEIIEDLLSSQNISTYEKDKGKEALSRLRLRN